MSGPAKKNWRKALAYSEGMVFRWGRETALLLYLYHCHRDSIKTIFPSLQTTRQQGLRKGPELVRCVHVIESAQSRCTGICQIVRGLARNAQSHQIEISVLFLQDGPLREMLLRDGIEAHVIPLLNARRDLASAANLSFWLRKKHADILHLHCGGRMLRLLCKLGGAHVLVQHVHSRIDEITGTVSNNLHFSGVDAVIACCQAIASSVRQYRTQVIYAGVEADPTPRSLMIHTGPLRVGVLSRLTPIKNIETLLLAAHNLRHRNLAIQVDIAGTGCSQTSLQKMATQLGVSDRVKFLGWREDVRELLSSWDLLVMTSLDEGFPVSALEAMAVGRPVLASRVGGLAELVIPGVTGELIPSRDPEAFATTIAKMAQDREPLARMGHEGWKRVQEKFSIQAMAQNTALFYEELLQGSHY